VLSSGGKMLIDIHSAIDLNDVIRAHEGGTGKNEIAHEKISEIKSIELCNLSYGYQSNSPILVDISGKLTSGNTYALVGKSGAGKSTLSDILLGLLTPISGWAMIGGLSYEKIDVKSIRRQMILVEQQTRIFSASIKENIKFGFFCTDDEINFAVDISGLRPYINSLPHGIDTLLDYQGANLSGGQRQRIGLARAIVRNPDVLILDEATSALDSQTRDVVLKNLKELYKNKILLFITHDINVIQAVNEVWHIKSGSLAIEQKVKS
jgi:ATP-binding cassette subfamily B protein